MDLKWRCHFPASVILPLPLLSFCASSVVQGVTTEIETAAQKWGDKTSCEHLSWNKWNWILFCSLGNMKTGEFQVICIRSIFPFCWWWFDFRKKPLNVEHSTFTHWIYGTQLFPPKMFLLKISTTLFQFQVFKFAIRKSDNFRTWN